MNNEPPREKTFKENRLRPVGVNCLSNGNNYQMCRGGKRDGGGEGV